MALVRFQRHGSYALDEPVEGLPYAHIVAKVVDRTRVELAERQKRSADPDYEPVDYPALTL